MHVCGLVLVAHSCGGLPCLHEVFNCDRLLPRSTEPQASSPPPSLDPRKIETDTRNEQNPRRRDGTPPTHAPTRFRPNRTPNALNKPAIDASFRTVARVGDVDAHTARRHRGQRTGGQSTISHTLNASRTSLERPCIPGPLPGTSSTPRFRKDTRQTDWLTSSGDAIGSNVPSRRASRRDKPTTEECAC